MKRVLIVMGLLVALALALAVGASAEEMERVWWYIIDGDEAEIQGYHGSGGNVTIPSMLGGKPVTRIRIYAFSECTELTGVTIPNSVTSIGEGTFQNCSSLTSVTIPDSVTSISQWAFSGCSGLTSVTIPNSVKSIGNEAFSCCSGLTSVTIPNSVTSISAGAFEFCSRLTSVTIPDSVTSIGNYAFACCTGLTSITIPSGVTSIGSYAFQDCTGLMSITIPSSVTSIDDYAFEGCTGLQRVDISELGAWCAIKFGEYDANPVSFSHVLYLNGKALTNVTIPDSVTSIGNYAFACCTGLTSVTIPGSVTSIGDGAFKKSSGLTSVMIPDSVTSIGKDAFSGCTGLQRVDISDLGAWCSIHFDAYASNPVSYSHVLYLNGKGITNMTIPEGVTWIGDYAFNKCTGLTSVTIPDSVTSIGKGAFSACTGLASVKISDSVIYIGDSAFSGCTGLTSATIPSSVTSIGKWAFCYCRGLTCVTIPSSVVSIGDRAFSECTGLMDIYYEGSEEQLYRIQSGSPFAYSGGTIHFNSAAPTAHILPEERITFSTISGTKVRASKDWTKTLQFSAGLYAEKDQITEMDVRWDPRMLNGSEYENDLAILGLILSANAEDEKPDLIKKTLNDLELKDIYVGNYDGYHGDNDKVGYAIAHIADGSDPLHVTEYVILVCRGSVGSFTDADWQSNLFSREEGFERAAENVVAGDEYATGLDEYIEQYVDADCPVRLFIVGHSRGGAVANDLAVKLENKDYVTREGSGVFVYTYACPCTTPKEQPVDYSNIFNIRNENDIVPTVPSFVNRRGVDIKFNRDKIESGLVTEFYSLTGLPTSAIDTFSTECYGNYALNGNFWATTKCRDHSPAIYMAYLISTEQKTASTSHRIKRIAVKCPVDVYVYDNNGQLLGAVINNEADDGLFNNGIFVVLDGDEKYLYVQEHMDLQIKLIGTDSGEMSYSVETIDGLTDEVTESRVFNHVALETVKTMSSTVASDIAVSDTQLFVETDGAITVAVDANGNETDVVMLSFDTDLGEPIRDMTVPKGSAAGELPTAKMDGYAFVGWYTDAALMTAFDTAAPLNSSLMLYAKYTPLYDVFGYFSEIIYDGTALTAKLDYEYCTSDANLFVALYQDGQMKGIQTANAESGSTTSTVTMPMSNLYGIYQLKAFILDATGNYTPICTSAEVSFYAN